MKRFIFVLGLLFSLLLVFGNVSFATPRTNWEDFKQFNYNGDYYEFFNDLCMTYYNKEFANLDIATGSSITNASSILSYFENNTYQYYQYTIIYYNASGINIYCTIFNPDDVGYRIFRIYKSTQSGKYLVALNYYQGGSDILFRGTLDNLGSGYQQDKYVVNTQQSYLNNEFYKSKYNTTAPPLINLKFVPSTNKYWNIDGVNFYVYEMSRNFSYISIGQLFNLDTFEDVVGRVYMFVDNNNFNRFITNTYNTIDGEQVQIDTNNLLYKQGYAVSFTYEDYTTPYYYIYFIAPGTTQENFSGDIVYTGNDNNTLQPIINQNQENQDFWRDTYNNLFTLSSGDANEVYSLVSSYFPSGDTPISIYDLIFGGLNNEASDFIIRWDDISYNATTNGGSVVYSGDFIKANSINFSKLTRDNATFGLVHFWIRTLAILSFCFIYFMTTYKCILLIFGVTTDFIDTSEDHRQIGFINDWRDKK